MTKQTRTTHALERSITRIAWRVRETGMGKIGKSEQIVFGVSKVGPKGQIIIPVELRNELGIKPGDQLVVARSSEGDGVLLLKAQVLNDLLKNTRYYTQ